MTIGQPVVHFEVVGRDGPSLRAFYADLFSWEFDADNPAGYGLIGREGNVSERSVGIGGGTPDYEGHVTFYVEVPMSKPRWSRPRGSAGPVSPGPHRVLDRVEVGAFCDPEGHMIGLVKATEP